MSIKSREKHQHTEHTLAQRDEAQGRHAVRALKAQRPVERHPIDVADLAHTMLVLSHHHWKTRRKREKQARLDLLAWRRRQRLPLLGGAPCTIEQAWGSGVKLRCRLSNGMEIAPLRRGGKVAPYTEDFRNYVAGKLAA